MDNNIDKNKENFNLEKIKLVINEVEAVIKQNVWKVVNLINDDNDAFVEKTSYSKMLEIIDQINEEKWCLDKSSKNCLIEALGNIGVIYDGNPYVFFYLCLKALKTNNSITFFETSEVHKIADYVINLYNDALKKYNLDIKIKTIRLSNLKDIAKYDESYAKYICVGEHQYYEKIKPYTNNEIIYSAYGTMSVYMDDKTLKDKLLDLDDYVFENNIKLDLYVEEEIDNVIKAINKSNENFCAVIFTKDINKASYFIKKVNSNMVFVNQNPFNEYRFEIEDFKLVKIKKIFI